MGAVVAVAALVAGVLASETGPSAQRFSTLREVPGAASPSDDAQATSPAVFEQSAARRFRARLSTVPIDLAMRRTVTGRGVVSATLVGTTLTIDGTYEGLTSPATVARLHRAAKGLRGPAILDVTVEGGTSGTSGTSGRVSGTFELTSAQVDDLLEGRLYLQLHSEGAPDGNLWGWLLPERGRS